MLHLLLTGYSTVDDFFAFTHYLSDHLYSS